MTFRNYQDKNQKAKKEKMTLYAYCDASFAANDDGKSQTGYCFNLGHGNGVFHCKSQKQTTIALSSTEAEHEAATETVKEIIGLRELLKELGFKQTEPTVIY